MRARVAILKDQRVPADVFLLPEKQNGSSDSEHEQASEKSALRPSPNFERPNKNKPNGPNSSFDPVTPSLDEDSKSSWGSITPATDLRSEQRPLDVIQTARERKATLEYQQFKEDTSKSIFLPLLAILGIALVSTAVMSAEGTRKDVPAFTPPPPQSAVNRPPPKITKKPTASAKKAKPRPATPRAISVKKAPPRPTAFKPIFGPLAASTCTSTCASQGPPLQRACERSCERLSLKDYARRISYSKPNPVSDSRKIASRCLLTTQKIPKINDRALWLEGLNDAMTTISVRTRGPKDYTSLRSLYSASSRSLDALVIHKDASVADRAITSAARQATCLRANLALTELGAGLTQRRQDAYSLEFYRNLRTLLVDITNEVEDRFVLQFRRGDFSQ